MKHLQRDILLEATSHDFEKQAVLNPAVWQDGNTLHMFYRAVAWGNHSTIGYARFEGPTKLVERLDRPLIIPEYDYEKQGIEDPRIVKLGDTFYLTYAAYDGVSSRIAYATSKDLKTFEKQGIISPNLTYKEAEQHFNQNKLKERYFFFSSYFRDRVSSDIIVWEKDGFFLPAKIKGKYGLVHRILPDVQVIFFDDFKQLQDNQYWISYLEKMSDNVLLENTHWFESRNIGGGAPLIETSAGWLMIYHGIEELNVSRIYSAGAALLDKDDLRVVGRLSEPLFKPTLDWEKSGDVRGVVFPTGTAIFDNILYIYYGAADSRIGYISFELDDLIREVITSA